MKKINYLIVFAMLLCGNYAFCQLQVGDPGVTFDQSKFDPDYPQMAKWITAGVRGGIPFIQNQNIKRTLNGGSNSGDINNAINQVANQGGGAVLLKNGTYRINSQVNMKSKVSLIGESRNGVKCVIYMNKGNGFSFAQGVKKSGIYRLTIQGSWGQPKYDWNIGSNANNELPGNENVSVKFKRSIDCWLDDVSIINSGDFPMRCNATHITIRNVKVDGCHNKHGGAHGYFFIQDAFNLITKCEITRIRHISLQGGRVRYNVVYDNDFKQEISFHSGDDGDNLIENNRIILPESMPGRRPNYTAVMGPWSKKHHLSKRPNYVYKNSCLEKNHDDATPWSNPNKIYDGPYVVRPNPDDLNALWNNFRARPNNKLPIGGTLYPINISTLSTDNYDIDNSVKIYPNPASERVTIDLPENSKGTFKLYTLTGKVLKNIKLTASNFSIDVSNLSAATYFTSIEINNKTIFKKLIIN